MSVDRQCTDTVFTVRPCRFQANPLTVKSNAFQADRPWDDLGASNTLAQQQFDGLVATLDRAGVRCLVFDDTPEPHTPDSVFPNNWITTHADGTVILYPMEATNRRGERRQDIIDRLREEHGFVSERIIDLSAHEQEGRYLEGTGSLVLDRVNRVAFACRSTRTDAEVFGLATDTLGYTPVLFNSVDGSGQPIYHTNVMMWVGSTLAGVCLESMSIEDQGLLLTRFAASEHQVLELSFAQLEAFAGNMLELRSASGEPVMALSQAAWDSLDSAQRRMLEAHAALAICPIDHIEQQSGGSVRCMLAEVHLPRVDRAG